MAIKTQPEDFVVEEELDSDFLAGVTAAVGPFALYEVRKRSLTTHELLDAMAKRLDVPVADLSAAGLKDKHALTTQHITLGIDANRRLPVQSIESPSFSARQLGFVPSAIGAHAIARNRFRLVIRGLTRRAIDEMHEAARRLMSEPADLQRGQARLRFTNYFGNQRFGSARAGQGFIAAHLVRGEFERALQLAIGVPHRKDLLRVKQFKQMVAEHWDSRRWSDVLKSLPKLPERAAIEHLARRPDDFRGAFAALPYFFQQLTVEAYQSILWNRIVTCLLVERLGEGGRLWVVDDTFSQLIFPEAEAIPADLRDLEVPLLGRKTALAEPWRSAATQVLHEEGLDVTDLRIPGLDKPWFGEVSRGVFAEADRLHLGNPQPDDSESKRRRLKVTTSFALPRGAYATVVLRAIGQ